MEKVSFSRARQELTDLVNLTAFHGDHFVITRNGKDVVAMVSIDDLETLEALEDQMDLQAARRVKKEIQKHGTIPWEEAKRELGL